MAVRPGSPTHAFDPTPALEHNPDNFSPLNQNTVMGPFVDLGASTAFPRNVRFSENSSGPIHGRHSIATTHVPLLPPVASASQLPKHSFPIHNPIPGVDISAYIEQCRNLNTQLRETHESERRVWDIERTALKARIKELEQKLNRARDPKRRSSNDSSGANLDSFQSTFAAFNGFNGSTRGRISSDSAIQSSQPVWKGPEFTPPVTRVFSHDDDITHLPSISEDDPLPPLTKELSPTSQEKTESVPVPIEQVDKTLDGITLRSTALTSSFNKVASPQLTSPAHSPSPKPKHPADGLMHVEMKGLLTPLDEKLKRHAGHTPMAFDGTVSTSSTSSERITPRQEKPYAPVPTRRPPLRPSEHSDSYFSFVSDAGSHQDVKDQVIREEPEIEEEAVLPTDEDPPLTGPLMLDPAAKSEASNMFLGLVDAKLSEAAARRSRKDSLLSNGSQEATANGRHEGSSNQKDTNDGPKLRVRNSTNFGSAWGKDAPGCV
jgi:hypothetical protein